MNQNFEELSLLIKPVSGRCNMQCSYCFYADVTSSREVADRGKMDSSILEQIVQRAFDEAASFVSFGFQGGEPMLAGLDFYRSLIDFEKIYNTRRIPVAYSIQTNGSLVDDQWASFLGENKFLVGLSIDGDKETNDLMRHDLLGKGTYEQSMKAADTLKKHDVDFNILSVVTKQFAENPETMYQFFKQQDFRFIQLISCLDSFEEGHGSADYSLDAKTYGEFLCRFFDVWYEDFIVGDYLSVRSFDNWVRMLMGQPPENCGMVGTCYAYPVIEADGSVYPCDFYVLDEHKLGDIQDSSFYDLLNSKAARQFEEPSSIIQDECLVCEYYFICRGGCRRDREPIEKDAPSLNANCEAYRSFFSYALPRMADIARKMPR